MARERGRFGWMEAVIVVALLLMLAGTVTPLLVNRQAARRDAKRLADLHAIEKAIEDFTLDRGEPPAHEADLDCGGWDTTLDGRFIPALAQSGYLPAVPLDPLNDAARHYCYRKFSGSSGKSIGGWYVLGLTGFETDGYRSQRRSLALGGRDWSKEFAYVTGGSGS